MMHKYVLIIKINQTMIQGPKNKKDRNIIEYNNFMIDSLLLTIDN